MSFDPKRYVIKVQGGREYLPVSARLIWFRSEHPDWGIVTEAVEIDLEKQYAIFRASIFNEEGRLIATATKREDVRGFGDYIEKAETGSVGRALVLCGYGTQFAPELEEGGRFADGNRGGGMAGRPNGNGAGGMRSVPPPAAPRPVPPQRPPVRESPPMADVYPDEPPPLRSAAPPPRPASAPPARPVAPPSEVERDELPPLRPASSLPRPAPRPVPPPDDPPPARPAPGGPIQRVREPDRPTADPGGDDEADFDPFSDEDAPPARPSRPAATRRPPGKPADTLL
jgi:hypothetical protein